MKKKENHIWPAYVDMMTVLLLVYVLVSLLFAMMIKQDTEAQYEQKLNSLMELTVTSDIGSDGANPHMSTGNIRPEEVITDENLDMLVRRDGDLILILQSGEEKITHPAQVKIADWYQKNRRNIEKKGVYFAVIIKKNNGVSVGALYRKQYMLYMDTLRYLVNTINDFKPANFSHRSPLPVSNLPEEYIVIRIANAQ